MEVQVKQGTHPPGAPSRKVVSVLDFDGRADADTDPHLDHAAARRIYEAMSLIRLVDARLMKLQRQGRIGFHVGCEGEEAAILASAAAMRDQDWLFPCYREVGAALYRGLPLQTYIDNMYGNANDIPKGRQMPDHVTARAALQLDHGADRHADHPSRGLCVGSEDPEAGRGHRDVLRRWRDQQQRLPC